MATVPNAGRAITATAATEPISSSAMTTRAMSGMGHNRQGDNMTIDEAKAYLSTGWVLHPQYQASAHHSVYALVDVRATCVRVRSRMRPSFASAVEQVKKRLRVVHGR
jgi:hypothetical protein